MTERNATWVYAITSGIGSDRADGLAGIAGIAGRPVRTVDEFGLTAVVSSVDADSVTEEALEHRLRDAGELEAMARAHHGVVERVAAQHPALPLRLATVYRDDDRVRGLLSDRRAEFTEALRWLDGRTECGVKIWVCRGGPKQGRGDATVPGWADNRQPGRDDSPGTAYLLQRRASMRDRDDCWQLAVTRGEQIHAALAALAVAEHRHVLQDSRLADEDGWMVLNGTYLLESDGIAEFAAAARALVAGLDGWRLEVTGPWPPYSFAGGTDS
jgi:Gas vesicle synthesis protein GvpL/GvpF